MNTLHSGRFSIYGVKFTLTHTFSRASVNDSICITVVFGFCLELWRKTGDADTCSSMYLFLATPKLTHAETESLLVAILIITIFGSNENITISNWFLRCSFFFFSSSFFEKPAFGHMVICVNKLWRLLILTDAHRSTWKSSSFVYNSTNVNHFFVCSI